MATRGRSTQHALVSSRDSSLSSSNSKSPRTPKTPIQRSIFTTTIRDTSTTTPNTINTSAIYSTIYSSGDETIFEPTTTASEAKSSDFLSNEEQLSVYRNQKQSKTNTRPFTVTQFSVSRPTSTVVFRPLSRDNIKDPKIKYHKEKDSRTKRFKWLDREKIKDHTEKAVQLMKFQLLSEKLSEQKELLNIKKTKGNWNLTFGSLKKDNEINPKAIPSTPDEIINTSKIRKQMNLEYNALFDSNARRFFDQANVRKHIRKVGLINDQDQVCCTLKEFNKYKNYLNDLYMCEVQKALENLEKDKAALWNQYESIRSSIRKERSKDLDMQRKAKLAQVKERIVQNQKEKEKKLELLERIRYNNRQRYLRQMELKREKKSKEIAETLADVNIKLNRRRKFEENRRKGIMELISLREEVVPLRKQEFKWKEEDERISRARSTRQKSTREVNTTRENSESSSPLK